MPAHPAVSRLSSLAGAALGGVFGAVAVARRGKPLHPRGTVYSALIRRSGMPEPWGSEWLDVPGENRGVARLSRAIGLPGPVPDVLGLAVSFTGRQGTRHDLLLASTGLSRVGRFLLIPRIGARRSSYGSLFPYEAPAGLVLLAAVPELRSLRAADAVWFRLLAAGPADRWQPFGTLELTPRAGDEPLRLDPVLHPLPGLRVPDPLARLRAPSYAAARRTPVEPGAESREIAGPSRRVIPVRRGVS
jgi:hypothetical protein